VLRLIAGREVRMDGAPLDLHTQALLRVIAAGGQPDFAEQEPAQARRWFEASSPTLGAVDAGPVSVESAFAPGPLGPVPLRIVRPTGTEAPGGVLLYLHGGGWVVGSVETHDACVREIAARTGLVTVSVDYRLAPEHRYPSGLDDVCAAYRWVEQRMGTLAGKGAPLAVGGDSAGGNLTAALCLRLRGEGAKLPRAQILIYPATDLLNETTSMGLFARGFFLTRASMRWFTGHYLFDIRAGSDPYVSPLLAADLSGLPEAIVVTAGFDPLRDEGKAYAARLQEAGVRVTALHEPTLIHGFLQMTAVVPAASRAVIGLCRVVRAAMKG
jgi:acetyl esterase